MDKLTIYTLGLAKDEPGKAAIAVQVTNDQGEAVLTFSELIGNGTSDYAEYFAVVRALQELKTQFQDKTRDIDFEIQSKSRLVINHLCAKEQIKDVGLIGHFIEIYNLRVADFPYLTPVHLNKNFNQKIEDLVTKELDD